MKKNVFYSIAPIIMPGDTLAVLQHSQLSTEQGLNLLLNGYGIGLCTLNLSSPFTKKNRSSHGGNTTSRDHGCPPTSSSEY
jgi:hypothetical protein